MGKATRWLKALILSIKGTDSSPAARPEHPRPPKEKRRWSFVKSYRDKSSSFSNPNPRRPPAPAAPSPPDDASKHAIVVAAASAAAADAAVAAAQAAAAVVRLTTTSRRVTTPSANVSAGTDRKISAALVIQSHFRGYLARRALKALKGLVKLQALVRGHIMRKKTAETMRCIQAMLRAQARARSVRSNDSPSSSGKSSQIQHPGPPTPEKVELTSHLRSTNSGHSGMLKSNGIHRNLIHPGPGYVSSSWSGPQLGESTWDSRGRHAQYHQLHHHHHHPREDYYLRPDKILEVDTGKAAPKHRKHPFDSARGGLDIYSDQSISYTHRTTVPSPGSCEVQSGFNMSTLKLSPQEDDVDDDGAFCTAENSPQLRRRRGTHTPTKSDASATSCFSGYSDCPSYMNYTESSRAKMRSMSAPKQRPQQHHQPQQQFYERGSSMKRWSVHQQRAVMGLGSGSATMQMGFASRAYPGSGHLDRLGMPVRNTNSVVYYSGYLN